MRIVCQLVVEEREASSKWCVTLRLGRKTTGKTTSAELINEPWPIQNNRQPYTHESPLDDSVNVRRKIDNGRMPGSVLSDYVGSVMMFWMRE